MEPLEHFPLVQPSSEIGKKQRMKNNRKLEGLYDALIVSDANVSGQSENPKRLNWPMARFMTIAAGKTVKIEVELAKSARYYIYSKLHVSKLTF